MLSAVVSSSPCADLQLPVPIPYVRLQCTYHIHRSLCKQLHWFCPCRTFSSCMCMFILIRPSWYIRLCNQMTSNVDCLHVDLSDSCECCSVIGTCSGWTPLSCMALGSMLQMPISCSAEGTGRMLTHQIKICCGTSNGCTALAGRATA